MKQSLMNLALIILFLFVTGTALANGNNGGGNGNNERRPAGTYHHYTGNGECKSKEWNPGPPVNNPEWIAGSCPVEQTPAPSNTPVTTPTAEASATPSATPNATEEVEPTDGATATPVATATDDNGNPVPVTSTPDGGNGNSGNTETDDDQSDDNFVPAATEPVRDFIPLPAEACDDSDVMLTISREIVRGDRINKDEGLVSFDITPSELEGKNITEIEVISPCVVALVADNALYTMAMDGSNLQPIMATDSTAQEYAVNGSEISVGNNGVIWYRRVDGMIAKTDASGSIDEGLQVFGRGISVSPDGQTLAYTDGNDNVEIVSVYGRNVLSESAGNQAIDTYWSPNGQFLFSIDQDCRAVAYDLVNKKQIPVGIVCDIAMDPTGEVDTFVSNREGFILNADMYSTGLNVLHNSAYLEPEVFTVSAPFLNQFSIKTEIYQAVECWDVNWVIPYDSVTLVTQAFGN